MEEVKKNPKQTDYDSDIKKTQDVENYCIKEKYIN